MKFVDIDAAARDQHRLVVRHQVKLVKQGAVIFILKDRSAPPVAKRKPVAKRDNQADQPRLHSVRITTGAAAIGKRLGELELGAMAVEVTALRRQDARTVTPASDTLIEEGDVLVLLGTEEGVAAAEIKLMQG